MPNPGRYFFHPHAGVQTDHGLYAPLIVDDPEEPGSYDVEQVVVLDDWTDGVGEDPDAILHRLLQSGGHGMGGMPGMQGAGQLLPLGRDTATSTTRSTCPTAGFPPHRTRSAPVPASRCGCA